ncbi:hypothetical protein HQ945_05495 [Phyllobacterium sp. BT25]|uniref:Uncharacterized protein n=1 Tax=Phyllobacterium pellucidum TaxID=2740464 RepID=A0A849VLL9_9HYPH|nr:hypothetical protein [Phyllobacterium pellucidum]NTS30701.1 hypothetical protein [Phyllobacterium pellucidum]
MDITDILKGLQDYPNTASDEFRRQLTIVETIKEQTGYQNIDHTPAVGMDRSREYLPVARPSLVRTYGTALHKV